MNQKIGIKFCGGCNPLYDRKEYADSLIKNNPGDRFEYAKEGMSFDVLYVICGCQRQCARFDNIDADRYVIVTNEAKEQMRQYMTDIHSLPE